MTRRTLLGGVALAAAAHAQKTQEWKPRLGVLGNYTESNVQFAKAEGFTNMILEGTPGSPMDPTKIDDRKIAAVKQVLDNNGMHVSAFQATMNHIDADPDKRKRVNDYFVRLIEVAGKLGIPYIGSASGKDEHKAFPQQVDEIVRVYNERYFPACEKSHVSILWEPWPEGPNIATSPVGYDALFKAFGNTQYVGLQYDPSHLVRQFMDPIQTARDYVDKIYDVHLKDTEIRWDILKRGGIKPVNGAEWWLYRLPGLGSINWGEFFGVLQRAGYRGAMSVEHEDPYYGSPNHGAEFSDDYKTGFKMAHRYLRQYVPD